MRAIPILGAMLIALTWALASPASAQTISYAEAIDRLGAACGKDIETLCKGVRLGQGTFECLNKNAAKVSDNCKATIATTIESVARRAAAQDEAYNICAPDIRHFCKEYDPGHGRILRCLLLPQNQISAACGQALTDAGWR